MIDSLMILSVVTDRWWLLAFGNPGSRKGYEDLKSRPGLLEISIDIRLNEGLFDEISQLVI